MPCQIELPSPIFWCSRSLCTRLVLWQRAVSEFLVTRTFFKNEDVEMSLLESVVGPAAGRRLEACPKLSVAAARLAQAPRRPSTSSSSASGSMQSSAFHASRLLGARIPLSKQHHDPTHPERRLAPSVRCLSFVPAKWRWFVEPNNERKSILTSETLNPVISFVTSQLVVMVGSCAPKRSEGKKPGWRWKQRRVPA